jgi:hypothetical protein
MISRTGAVEAEPMPLSSQIGMYANFVNFLDMAVIAVLSGFHA